MSTRWWKSINHPIVGTSYCYILLPKGFYLVINYQLVHFRDNVTLEKYLVICGSDTVKMYKYTWKNKVENLKNNRKK